MNYIDYLNSEVDRAIYVRGSQGENLLAMQDAPGWIRYMETTRRSDYAQHQAEYDRNADRAIALYEKRRSEGVSPLRAYDCSGLTVKYAMDAGIITKDYTAAGIYSQLCRKISGVPTVRGQLVFRATSGSITHMGTYVGNGQVIECRGRDYGVIRRAYKESDWTHTGEWPALMLCCSFMTSLRDMSLTPDQIKRLQQTLNDLGYTDDDGHDLTVDGKLGARTRAAFDHMIRYNIPELRLVPSKTGPIWLAAEEL